MKIIFVFIVIGYLFLEFANDTLLQIYRKQI
jgi:hypothetical protein